VNELKPKILIVDDDRTVCQSLRLLFMTRGFDVHYLINPLNTVEFIESFKPGVLLLDLNFSVETSGKEGLHILQKIKKAFPALPVVLITAWGTLELAVEGMKSGAADFITKPWDNDSLVSAVNTQIRLQQNVSTTLLHRLENIPGESEAMKEVKQLLPNVALTDASILITGDRGTGKELIAEAIHDLSNRSEHPFIKMDIAGLPDEYFDRELTGYRKNTFPDAASDKKGTLAQAGAGTLFMDEIAGISLPAQTRLLKILEERRFEPVGSNIPEKVMCRFIASSCNNLSIRALENNFREDLFYKLSLVHIHLPPLSERREDIPELARHFIMQLNQGNKTRKIEEHALEWLSTQEFEGNVRQLKTLIERTWLLSENYTITIKELKKHSMKEPASQTAGATLEELEKNTIRKAIELKKGNMSEVAKNLGITRSALYRRMSKFGLTNPNKDED
jgi:two-component system NtrC family response regulator